MESAFDVKFAFNRFTLGDDFCKDRLGFTDAQLNDYSFNMLEALGFEKDAIEAANTHVCGSMTLEGAPHLKDCLLYTSPSPRDRTRSRMPSSA